MEQNNIIVIQGEEQKSKGVHYEIDPSREPIGKGGTGVVRVGQMVDERTGVRRDVAIKFLYDDMPANMLVRSQREASIRVLSENLVEMIDFVQISETDVQGRTIVHSHVVSELLHGVMLLDILKGVTTDKDGNEVQAAREYHDLMLSDRNQFAMKIVRNVLSGIQALHDNGYIHRDIDPSNIMITDRGKVKLIDLGIAKKIDSMQQPDEQHLTSTGQFIGKAAYAAPELVLGDLANQNETTDIYAIGIMLYLLVVGKLPFNGPLQEILHMQCNEKMPVQDIKDKGIRKIVKAATEKRQSERYQSAAEFRVAVDAVCRQFKAVKPSPVIPHPSPTSTVVSSIPESGTVVSSIPESGTVVSSVPESGTVVPSIPESGTVVSSVPESGTVVGAPAEAPAMSGTVVGGGYTPQPAQQSRKSNTLLYIIAAVAVIVIGAGVFFLTGTSSSSGGASDSGMPQPEQTAQAETPSVDIVTAAPEPSGSSESVVADAPASETAAPTSATAPSAEPSASTAPKVASPATTPAAPATKTTAKPAVKTETPAAKPAAKPAPSGNGMKLSYGTYTGPVKNGYPNGKGKLVYTKSRQINKYDSKGIVAQPGEYVEGLFVNGFLTVGKHYSADGQLLNKISAGVAEGVYEAK